jgi:hypothetical protein
MHKSYSPWQAASGAGGKRTYHVCRRVAWIEDGVPRSHGESLVDRAGRPRRFASYDAAKAAAKAAQASETN